MVFYFSPFGRPHASQLRVEGEDNKISLPSPNREKFLDARLIGVFRPLDSSPFKFLLQTLQDDI